MPNYKLVLQYDGTGYNGWQRQGNTDNTIQEKVETCLEAIFNQPVEVVASGRTDAGVHALGQVCSFRVKTKKSESEILSELRNNLPQAIGAISLEEAEPRFHARLSCKRKTYQYRIKIGSTPDVFGRKYFITITEPLNIDEMLRAADLLIGKHDFSAFCSKNKNKNTIRELYSIDIENKNDYLFLSFTGNGFLYNMVRILTGTLIEVGLGKRTVESVTEALESLDRSNSGFTAPAQGLFLVSAKY